MYVVTGRKRHIVMLCYKSAQQAEKGKAQMIADGFNNVRIAEHKLGA